VCALQVGAVYNSDFFSFWIFGFLPTLGCYSRF
jgi:hypothetical protein